MIKKIGIEIDDVLWDKIKVKAIQHKKTLKEYLEFILKKDIQNA